MIDCDDIDKRLKSDALHGHCAWAERIGGDDWMSAFESGTEVLADRTTSDGPIEQRYEADLLGNIQQTLAGLQGFEVMALELIQNADDAGAAEMRFDVRRDGLHVWNSAKFSSCGLSEHVCPLIETDGRP